MLWAVYSKTCHIAYRPWTDFVCNTGGHAVREAHHSAKKVTRVRRMQHAFNSYRS